VATRNTRLAGIYLCRLSESAAAIERPATFFKVVIGIGTDRGLSA
jgi:hypothetical protein